MKKIALFISQGKPEAVEWAETTAAKIIEMGSECIASPELLSQFSNENLKIKPVPTEQYDNFADVVISFGGDGTMLSASRAFLKTNMPIMGFNVGKLGFLAEYSVSELEKSLKDLMEGNYRVVDRSIIETDYDGETIYALNDVVIEKKDSSRMITVHAFANKNFIGEYRADGIILTSPTGSTAYSLSCGGPIIAPATEVFCMTPISPHSLTLRPLVIPDSTEITLKVISHTGYANFVADGQVERTLKNNESLLFRKSHEKIKLIKPLETSYFDLLRQKLLWASNFVQSDENPE